MRREDQAEAVRRLAEAGDWHSVERLAARRGRAALVTAIWGWLCRRRAAIARRLARRPERR